MVGDVSAILLPLHQLRREAFRYQNAAPGRAHIVAAHELGRVVRPADEVLVDLEGPRHALAVLLQPVDLRLVARLVIGGPQRENAAVLGAVGVQALVLVEERAFRVEVLQRGRGGLEPGDVVASARRLQLCAHRRPAQVRLGLRDLDRLHVDDAVVAGRVVVGHHDLALELAGGIDGLLAAALIDVQAALHHVAVCQVVADDRARRLLAHDLGEQVSLAEELDELARHVHRAPAVARIRPEDVLRPVARHRRGDDRIGVRGQRPVVAGDDPGEGDRSAKRDVNDAALGVEEEVALNLRRGGERPVGRVPVHPLGGDESVAEVIERLVALGREAGDGRLERAHGRGGIGLARALELLLARIAAKRTRRRRHGRVVRRPFGVHRIDAPAPHGDVERRRARRRQ